MSENLHLPAPKDSFIGVLNYLALGVLVGSIKVGAFDEAINALIKATDGELQAELTQLKLTIKRSFLDVG